MATFLSADLNNAKLAQMQGIAQVKEYEAAIKQSSAAIKELRPQVSAASSLQSQLATDTQRAALSLSGEREDLNRARVELDAIRDVSAKAGEALGGIAINQDLVTAASQRMAANLAAAKARIEGLSVAKTGGGQTTAGSVAVDVEALNAQRRATLEARREWVNAQGDVKALAQQMRTAEVPTQELGAAFGAAQAKARLAKLEYEAQRQALVALGGSARSSFTELGQGTSQVAAASGAALNAQRALAPAIRQTGSAAGDAANKGNAFGFALGNIEKNSRQTLSLAQRLRGEILSLTASYIGFQAALGQVSGATDAFRQLEAVQNRLGAVYDQNGGKVASEIQFLQQQADRLGISFSTLSDEYGKFAIAAKAANFTSEDTRRIFLSVAEASRVNKLSAEQTSGVFLALTQMISKGKFLRKNCGGSWVIASPVRSTSLLRQSASRRPNSTR